MTEKMVATIGVTAVAVILAMGTVADLVVNGEVEPMMVTILATLAGVLLGVPITNGATRYVNGKKR